MKLIKQIKKDVVHYDGYSYNSCADHPAGVDRWTSNNLGIHIESNTPEQEAVIDQINVGLSVLKNLYRVGVPFPERIKQALEQL